MTVVYLENLGFEKIGQNSNAVDVAWLHSQGYQVIELDYGHSAKAVSPVLNKDIIAINSSLQGGSFCGVSCSSSRSYILMEGYRLQRDISYYLDDPAIYNYPDSYKSSQGDSLFLDLVYPANPSHQVPVVVTFSYSNSYATNKHKRMYLPYAWGAFKDSFVEGVSALAVGDGQEDAFEDASRGRFGEESSAIQCAVLGPGMFDYGQALSSSTEYSRMDAYIKATAGSSWSQQGALTTIQSSASAPTLFYHNADDFFSDKNKNPNGLYATQAQLMKEALEKVGVETEMLTGYSTGHAVPRTEADLQRMYSFLLKHVPTATGITSVSKHSDSPTNPAFYDLSGRRACAGHKGPVIYNGRLYFFRVNRPPSPT